MSEYQQTTKAQFDAQQQTYTYLTNILASYDKGMSNQYYWQATASMLEKQQDQSPISQILKMIVNYKLENTQIAFDLFRTIVEMPKGTQVLWKHTGVISKFIDLEKLKLYYSNDDKMSLVLVEIFKFSD